MYKRFKQTMRSAVFLAIGFALAGCERIDALSNAPETHVIPASLGDLVAVMPTDRRFETIMFFKQPDQTITAVQVNLMLGTGFVYKTKYPRN